MHTNAHMCTLPGERTRVTRSVYTNTRACSHPCTHRCTRAQVLTQSQVHMGTCTEGSTADHGGGCAGDVWLDSSLFCLVWLIRDSGGTGMTDRGRED